MARLPRFTISGQPQHVIQRGNNRDPIFVDDEDYPYYLERLQDAAEKYQVDIHAYVLMTDHVHLLVTPWQDKGISAMMQSIGRYFDPYGRSLPHRRPWSDPRHLYL